MYDFESAIARMAEARILEAIQNGAFENLPGRGMPLDIDDLSLVPEEFRVGYILLKNSGFLPEEMELHKEITSMQRMLDACTRDEDKSDLQSRLLSKSIRYRILMEKRKQRTRPPLL